MPPKKAVSDDEEEEEEDWDELYTDEEDSNGQVDSQTPAEIHKRLLKGSLNQPRHTVISLMTLHGEHQMCVSAYRGPSLTLVYRSRSSGPHRPHSRLSARSSLEQGQDDRLDSKSFPRKSAVA